MQRGLTIISWSEGLKAGVKLPDDIRALVDSGVTADLIALETLRMAIHKNQTGRFPMACLRAVFRDGGIGGTVADAAVRQKNHLGRRRDLAHLMRRRKT